MSTHNSYQYTHFHLPFPVIRLPRAEMESLAKGLGKQGQSKKAAVFRCIAQKPGVTTDVARISGNCSNIPDMVYSINKKLMNRGLMIYRESPKGVAPNAGFHHWYLVEAPIMQVDVAYASNDPRFSF